MEANEFVLSTFSGFLGVALGDAQGMGALAFIMAFPMAYPHAFPEQLSMFNGLLCLAAGDVERHVAMGSVPAQPRMLWDGVMTWGLLCPTLPLQSTAANNDAGGAYNDAATLFGTEP